MAFFSRLQYLPPIRCTRVQELLRRAPRRPYTTLTKPRTDDPFMRKPWPPRSDPELMRAFLLAILTLFPAFVRFSLPMRRRTGKPEVERVWVLLISEAWRWPDPSPKREKASQGWTKDLNLDGRRHHQRDRAWRQSATIRQSVRGISCSKHPTFHPRRRCRMEWHCSRSSLTSVTCHSADRSPVPSTLQRDLQFTLLSNGDF